MWSIVRKMHLNVQKYTIVVCCMSVCAHRQLYVAISSQVSSVKKRIFQKHEASLVASMALLESIIQHITEKQLMYNKKVSAQ